jgi:hypothetical protein
MESNLRKYALYDRFSLQIFHAMSDLWKTKDSAQYLKNI